MFHRFHSRSLTHPHCEFDSVTCVIYQILYERWDKGSQLVKQVGCKWQIVESLVHHAPSGQSDAGQTQNVLFEQRI